MKRALALAIALIVSTNAYAVTAGDFLDRMNEDERAGFMTGALDMLSYELATGGQAEKAQCILNWYFEGEGPQQVAALFPNHKDLPAVAVLRTLAERHCKP